MKHYSSWSTLGHYLFVGMPGQLVSMERYPGVHTFHSLQLMNGARAGGEEEEELERSRKRNTHFGNLRIGRRK